MWLLFILLLYLLRITHAQLTSAPSAAPVFPACRVGPYATSCQYCEVGTLAIIGAPNATANPLQDLRLGPYSLIIRTGRHQSDFSASQLIEFGLGTGTIYLGSISPTVVAQTVAMGLGSTSIQIASQSPTVVTQTLSMALGTSTVNFGSQSSTLIAQTINAGLGATTINIGSTSTTVSVAQTINLGVGTQTINIGTSGPTMLGTITINVGATSPTPAQNVRIGVGAPSVIVGSPTGAFHSSQSTILGGGSINIIIGWQTPTTQPTQTITLGQGTGAVNIGSAISYSGQTVALGVGSGTVNIGSIGPTVNPAQTVNVGNFAATLNLGHSALAVNIGTTAANAIVIGINSGVTSGVPVSVGTRALLLEMGTVAGTINLGVQQATSQVINIGFTSSPSPTPTSPTLAPSLSGSSVIKLNGIYHHAYSAECLDTANNNNYVWSGAPRCTTNIQGNIPATPTPTPNYGYVYTATPTLQPYTYNKFYPTQVGHWFVTFQCLLAGDATGGSGNQGAIAIYKDTTEIVRSQKDLNGGIKGWISATASSVITFNTIGGATDVIYLLCEDCFVNDIENFCRFSAFRIG